jgi:hypothetical protein
MTGQDYRTIARVIRDLPCDRLVVAERFAAMFAKEDPHFNRNRFLAAALWGVEQRADGAVAAADCRSRTRRALTQAIAVQMELGR